MLQKRQKFNLEQLKGPQTDKKFDSMPGGEHVVEPPVASASPLDMDSCIVSKLHSAQDQLSADDNGQPEAQLASTAPPIMQASQTQPILAANLPNGNVSLNINYQC